MIFCCLDGVMASTLSRLTSYLAYACKANEQLRLAFGEHDLHQQNGLQAKVEKIEIFGVVGVFCCLSGSLVEAYVGIRVCILIPYRSRNQTIRRKVVSAEWSDGFCFQLLVYIPLVKRTDEKELLLESPTVP